MAASFLWDIAHVFFPGRGEQAVCWWGLQQKGHVLCNAGAERAFRQGWWWPQDLGGEVWQEVETKAQL